MREIDFLDISEYVNESEYTQFIILNLIKKKEDPISIYKIIIPRLINHLNPNTIYNAIYDIIELKNEIYSLINHDDFKVRLLNMQHINELLKSKSTRQFIFDNISELNPSIDLKIIIGLLEKETELRIKNTILNLQEDVMSIALSALSRNIFTPDELFFENEAQISFFDHTCPTISESDINNRLLYLIKNCDSKTDIVAVIDKLISYFPTLDLGYILTKNFKNPTFNEYILANIEKLIPNLKKYTIELLELSDSKRLLSTYKNLLQLRRLAKVRHHVFDNLISQNKEELITSIIDKYLEISKSKEIKFIGRGSTSFAYKIGDFCMKISANKYTNDCPSSYRIIKTIEHIRLNDEIEIEIQKYLPPMSISDQDIYELMIDLIDQGLSVTDPHILNFKTDNFGFLTILSDADIDDINNLPPHFIEKPLVIFDKDLIYLKNDPNKRQFIDGMSLTLEDITDAYIKYKKKPN